jgi:hypothetical protein
MNPILHRPTARLRWLLAAAWLLITALAIATPALGFPSKLTCGKPKWSGRLTVNLVLHNDAGAFGYPEVSVEVDSSWTAAEKANFLRAEFWARLALRDSVLALGTTAEVKFEGQRGWWVESIQVIRDDSQEPDLVALGIPFPDQEALCSLSGVATGRDVHNGPAFVRLTVGQTTVTQPTQPGMPASVVEQMLIGQLNQAGIQARFATPDDFTGCYQTIPHDGSVIWFLVPDTTGFREEITDVGLPLDIAAVLNGSPDSPAAVSSEIGVPGLRLDVDPSLFSREGVRIRYSAVGGAGEGPVRIDVFDVSGRSVRKLFESDSAAEGALAWDGRDTRSAFLPGGVYFVRLSTPRANLVSRVVRVRD